MPRSPNALPRIGRRARWLRLVPRSEGADGRPARGAPAVGAQGERDDDGEDRGAPERPRRAPGARAARRRRRESRSGCRTASAPPRPAADRVPFGDLAEPVGQAEIGTNVVGDEGQREDDQEGDPLDGVGRADDQADQRPEPEHRDREQDSRRSRRAPRRRSMWIRQPTIRPLTIMTAIARVVARAPRCRWPSRIGAAGHRQRAEAVDDPLRRGRSRSRWPGRSSPKTMVWTRMPPIRYSW